MSAAYISPGKAAEALLVNWPPIRSKETGHRPLAKTDSSPLKWTAHKPHFDQTG